MSVASPPTDVRVAVVIPTSDRAALAIAACRSLLEQTGIRLEVFVSDNSTRADESARLRGFCRERNDERLTYLRPDTPLTMPSHWDWALEQALKRSRASHFMVHYDRRITKPGHLGMLVDVASRFPGRLVTYAADHISHEPSPWTVWQTPWTGRVYEMQTARVVELTTRAMINEMGHAFPILSNCFVPRSVLETVRARFGNICDSTGPDSCFTYRYCAMYDDYLHVDRAMGVIYAAHRSNGLGYLRQKGGDFGKFKEAWGDRAWLDAAPIPGLNLGQNMLFHEYELVRRSAGERFPPIDRGAYLRALALALKWIPDVAIKEDMRALLERHGLRAQSLESRVPVEGAAWPTSAGESERGGLPARVANRLVYELRYYAYRRFPTVGLFLADCLGITPVTITGVTFASESRALHYALMLPRRRETVNPYLAVLQPREILDPAHA